VQQRRDICDDFLMLTFFLRELLCILGKAPIHRDQPLESVKNSDIVREPNFLALLPFPVIFYASYAKTKGHLF
jgi:hypothetical protein